MKKMAYLLIFALLFSCSRTKKANEKQITVFAAASLTGMISDLSSNFEKEKGVTVKLNLAASGTLARQIDQGADADVYLSANKNWMDFLVDKGKSRENRSFARNDLVLISPINKEFNFEKVDSLLKATKSKIAIGDPGYVPAGKYAMQVFKHFKLVLDGKLMEAQDVRSALMMVELGEVDFGIVYKTDALESKKVKVIYTFPEESHNPVEYYQVLISKKNLAIEFYDYLYSPKAKQVLTKYSFNID